MIKTTMTTLVLICAALSAAVHADLDGTYKTITLDGSLSEWSNPGDVLYDDAEIGDGEPANSSYEGVYVANDLANLYVALDTKGTGGGSISNTWKHSIYIDTDMNTTTGFNGGWLVHGYDILIEWGSGGANYTMYEFTGATQGDWAWNYLGLVSYSYSDDIIELALPLSLLGVASNSLVMEINVGGTVETETWAAEFESSAETYTLGEATVTSITLDGSLDDWNPGDIFYTDAEIGDGTPTNSSYEGVYVVNDAANLYLGLDTKGTGGGSISNTWTRNIYMDTDENSGTGFNGGWMANGYDRLVQFGSGGTTYSVFEFTGAAQGDWTWNFLGLVDYSYSDDIIEISVPLTSLGVASNSLVIELNVTGTGITTETWAAATESDAKTYDLVVPKPVGLKTITLDGDLSEWYNPEDVLYTDAEITDGSPSNSSYEAVYAANDTNNLYFALDMKGSGGAAITNNWWHNIYVDTDMDVGTGFDSGWMANGYDILLEYGNTNGGGASGNSFTVFEFTGATQGDWAWNPVGTFAYAYSADVVELGVPMSLLGITGTNIVIELNVVGPTNVVTVQTWAHADEGAAKTYAIVQSDDGISPIGTIGFASIPGAGMAVSWVAAIEQAYDVEYKNDLANDPIWLNYTSLVAGANGGISVTTTVDQAETFYRVVTP